MAVLPVVCVVLYLRDPAEGGIYPPCPFRSITGLDCPGCGTTRALHTLLHGHPGRAFGLNPLAVLALPVLGFALASLLSSVVRGRPLATPRLPGWTAWALGGVVVAFWILRNLPFFPFAWMASYR